MITDIDSPKKWCFYYSALDGAGNPLTDLSNAIKPRKFCGKSPRAVFIDLGQATVGETEATGSPIDILSVAHDDIGRLLSATNIISEVPFSVKDLNSGSSRRVDHFFTYLEILNHPQFLTHTIEDLIPDEDATYTFADKWDAKMLPAWKCSKKFIVEYFVTCMVEVDSVKGTVTISKQGRKKKVEVTEFPLTDIGKDIEDKTIEKEPVKCLRIKKTAVCSPNIAPLNRLMDPLYLFPKK